MAARRAHRGGQGRQPQQRHLPLRPLPTTPRPPRPPKSDRRDRTLDTHRRLAHPLPRHPIRRPRRGLLHPPPNRTRRALPQPPHPPTRKTRPQSDPRTHPPSRLTVFSIQHRPSAYVAVASGVEGGFATFTGSSVAQRKGSRGADEAALLERRRPR